MLLVDAGLHVGLADANVVTERDERGRRLGCHDACELRGPQHVALRHVVVAHKSHCCATHVHDAAGIGHPDGGAFLHM